MYIIHSLRQESVAYDGSERVSDDSGCKSVKRRALQSICSAQRVPDCSRVLDRSISGLAIKYPARLEWLAGASQTTAQLSPTKMENVDRIFFSQRLSSSLRTPRARQHPGAMKKPRTKSKRKQQQQPFKLFPDRINILPVKVMQRIFAIAAEDTSVLEGMYELWRHQLVCKRWRSIGEGRDVYVVGGDLAIFELAVFFARQPARAASARRLHVQVYIDVDVPGGTSESEMHPPSWFMTLEQAVVELATPLLVHTKNLETLAWRFNLYSNAPFGAPATEQAEHATIKTVMLALGKALRATQPLLKRFQPEVMSTDMNALSTPPRLDAAG